MAAQGTGATQGSKCAHVACKCTVKPGEQFCSDYCAKAAAGTSGERRPAAVASHDCKCGPPDIRAESRCQRRLRCALSASSCTSPNTFCTFPAACFASPFACCDLLPVALPAFS